MVDFAIRGDVAPGFDAVAEVFERNFTEDIEVGASFCAVVNGVTVVDLWVDIVIKIVRFLGSPTHWLTCIRRPRVLRHLLLPRLWNKVCSTTKNP